MTSCWGFSSFICKLDPWNTSIRCRRRTGAGIHRCLASKWSAADEAIILSTSSKEKTKLYKTYVTIHSLAITAAFSVAAVWTIMSALQHQRARDRCLTDFFGGQTDDSQGSTLCTIFPWVDVGIMGGLWVMLMVFHVSTILYIFASAL
jgi:hypothetical protein